MGFNNKESFTQKAAQLYKYINSIPSYDELYKSNNINEELVKKFISSLEPDLIEEKNEILKDSDSGYKAQQRRQSERRMCV